MVDAYNRFETKGNWSKVICLPFSVTRGRNKEQIEHQAEPPPKQENSATSNRLKPTNKNH